MSLRRLTRVLVVSVVFPIPAAAQNLMAASPEMNLAITPGAHLFMGLLTGILLALAFQLVLTNLSIGLGVSAAGRIQDDSEKQENTGHSVHTGRRVRKITASVGIWTVLVSSISLFFASWLAVRLSLAPDLLTGIALALAVWAGVYLFMMAVESYAAISLAGSVWSTAKSVLTSAKEGVSSALQPSAHSQAAQTAKDVTAVVRQEMFGDDDAAEFRGRIERYVRQLSPARAEERRHFSTEEMSHVRGRLEQFLRATGKEQLQPESLKNDLQKAVADPSGAADSLRSRLSGLDAQAVASVLRQRTDMSEQEAKQAVERVRSVIGELRSKFNDRRQKVSQASEGALHELRRLFDDPKSSADALIQRFKSLDRESIEKIVSTRTDLTPEQVDQTIEQIENVREQAMEKTAELKKEVERRLEKTRLQALDAMEEARKTAATAAWWMLAAATCSAVAAALGGYMAIPY